MRFSGQPGSGGGGKEGGQPEKEKEEGGRGERKAEKGRGREGKREAGKRARGRGRPIDHRATPTNSPLKPPWRPDISSDVTLRASTSQEDQRYTTRATTLVGPETPPSIESS